MEPGGFRIKKVGEDLPKESEVGEGDGNIEEALSASTENEETVIPPPEKKENPLRLARRPGQAPIKEGVSCPECNSTVEQDAVMCVSCGFNLKKGKQVKTKYKKKSASPSFPNRSQAQKPKKRGPSAFSNFVFYTVILAGIGGGLYYFLVMPALEKAEEKKAEVLCKVKLRQLGHGFPETLDNSVKCPTSGRVYEFYWPKDGTSPFKSRENRVLARCFKHYNGVGTDGAVKHFPKIKSRQVGYEQMRDLILGKVKTKADILRTLNKPFAFEPYNVFDVDHNRYNSSHFNDFDSKYGTITIHAWREMEAINYGGRGLAITAKKGGKKFKSVKILAFKLPEGISDSKVKVILDKEDKAWFKKNLK